eukprot:1178702-Prorocentrum_minimum.AAC.2
MPVSISVPATLAQCVSHTPQAALISRTSRTKVACKNAKDRSTPRLGWAHGGMMTARVGSSSRGAVGLSRKAVRLQAVAGFDPTSFDKLVSIDNEESDTCTVINIKVESKPGLLHAVTGTIIDLGLVVSKAEKNSVDSVEFDKFFVTDFDNKKVYDIEDLTNIQICVAAVVDKLVGSTLPVRPLTEQYVVEIVDDEAEKVRTRRSEVLYSLMDTYIKNDIHSIQASIVNHVEYTIARSRYRFDDFEAYQVRIKSATALSVRDRLIEGWNDTQRHFREQDPKRVYYISMEFLTGRALLNSAYNLGVKDKYTEALAELGYKMEILAQKERDAALGNGGLGRLAACFLDSMTPSIMWIVDSLNRFALLLRMHSIRVFANTVAVHGMRRV